MAVISIHASRGGSDAMLPLHQGHILFQSTLPVGEATVSNTVFLIRVFVISIHASRGGSDLDHTLKNLIWRISIHASRGGSDAGELKEPVEVLISIHASRGGSDGFAGKRKQEIFNFNPRFPWGKRLGSPSFNLPVALFQSTLPVGEATCLPGPCGNSC